MTLIQYLRLVYKHRLILLVGVAFGLGVGMYNVSTSERSYSGGVSFFVSSVGEGTVASANAGDQFALRRVNSYLALLRTARLAQSIVEDSGLDLSPGAVREKISGSADLNTVLLRARVADSDRAQALSIAESIAAVFPDLVEAVERPANGDSTVRLEVVSGPSVSVVPVPTRWLLASRMLAGLLVAAVLALARELTDTRLHSIDQALGMTDAPLLGLVSNDRSTPGAPLIVGRNQNSVRAEEYRQIRTSLQFVDGDNRLRVIVVTSSIPSEGKSVTAANLAISIARSGQRVALVDADLRKPMMGTLFGIEQAVGLTDVLRGRAELDDVLQFWGDLDLAILPAGGTTSNPSELLGTVATHRLLTDLRNRCDTVIIDTPPLVPVTDAAIMAARADGVVLLVRPNKVTRAQFQQALSRLTRGRANLLGLVGSVVAERSNPYVGKYSAAEPDADDGPDVRAISSSVTALRDRSASALKTALDRTVDDSDARRRRRGTQA